MSEIDLDDLVGARTGLSPGVEHWFAILLGLGFFVFLVILMIDLATGSTQTLACEGECEAIYLSFDDPVKHGLNECYQKCNWDNPKVYHGKTNPR